MRLAGWTIDGYGGLSGWSVDGLGGAAVIVVVGANESGKSTLRDFLTSMLYGFSPATRDTHPYAPDAGSFGGTLTMIDEQGEHFTVHRELRSAPRGRVHRAERHEDVANRPLPALASIPRVVFQGLHSIGPEDVVGIGAASWQAVEERVLTGSMVKLRPVADVRRGLDDAAAGLWRPDKRGQPLARRLRSELSELRCAEREAMIATQRLATISSDLGGIAAQEAELQERLARSAGRRRRHDQVAPALAAIADADRLEARATVLLALDDLPADPEQALRASTSQASRSAAAEREAAQRAAQYARDAVIGEGDQALLRCGPRIQAAVRQEASVSEQRVSLTSTREALDAAERRVDRLAEALLARPLEAADAAALAAVQPVTLREALHRHEHAARRRRGRTAPFAAVVIACLAAAAVTSVSRLVLGLVVALTLAAYVAAHFTRRAQKQRATGQVRSALEPLLVDPQRLATPDTSLVLHVEELAAALDELGQHTRRRDQLTIAIRQAQQESRALMATLAVASIDEARTKLDQARAVQAQAQRAGAELARAQRDVDHHHDSAAEATAAAEALRRRLAELHPNGDVEAGIDAVREARRLRAAAQELRRGVARTHGAVEALQREAAAAQAAGECLVLSERDLAALNAEVEDARRQLAELARQRGGLDQERLTLEAAPSAADVAGRGRALEDRIEQAHRERDRLALASSFLREAERRYRERFGPAFLGRASRYVAAFTHGRWDAILLGEGRPAATPELELRGPHLALPVAVAAPLSRGTREQVYLALRLALVDELDPQRLLPLFCDETFVHWDEHRVGALTPILSALAPRQVIIATCHTSLAERLVEAGAVAVALEPQHPYTPAR